MRNRRQEIIDARFWAEEFLRRLDTFEEKNKDFMEGKNFNYDWPSRDYAVVKRASLDLSQCLVALRKSVWDE